jgi:uncharacterized protein with PIN domain
MPSASIRFYGELNDFLPPERRKVRFQVSFESAPSVKDVIESFGVPHTEVDVVLVNQSSVGFSYKLKAGDDIAVYPVFESFDVSPLVRLRPKPLRTPSFIGDVHLGRLCRMLRILGFDTLYRSDNEDREIVACAVRERRIILTRDRGVLKYRAVTHGYWVRSVDWREQTREVVTRFDLAGSIRPFTVCPVCNGKIIAVDKSDVAGQLEKKTRLYYDEFSRCGSCGKVYWKGSHYVKLRGMIAELAGLKTVQGENQGFSVNP